ncbi:hypothetical protein, partial [Nonomuraea composti]
HLVLGRRQGSQQIATTRLPVDKDHHDWLRSVCAVAIERLISGSPRLYEPNAELEPRDEYFMLDVGSIPEQPVAQGKSGSDSSADDGNPDRAAALIRSLRDISILNVMSAQDLPSFKPMLFYSISWQQNNDTWIHFIRKANPRVAFKAGNRWFQYSGTLREIAEPSMVLDDVVDVILTKDHMAAFHGTHLKNLLTDVRIVMQNVPQYVETIVKALKASDIGITENAQAALQAAAGRLYSFATRLFHLQDRLTQIQPDPAHFAKVLGTHDIEVSAFINSDGLIDFDERQAGLFIDVIDGRLFRDDWTGEERRADRFSKRSLVSDEGPK